MFAYSLQTFELKRTSWRLRLRLDKCYVVSFTLYFSSRGSDGKPVRYPEELCGHVATCALGFYSRDVIRDNRRCLLAFKEELKNKRKTSL